MDDMTCALGPEPIAIIGLSAIMPKAASVGEFWRNIVTGADCLEDVPETRWRLSDYFSQNASERDKTYGRRGGFMPDLDFDPVEFGMPPSVLDSTDPAQLFGLALARAALVDAGYPALSETDHHRTSVILGVAGTTMQRAGSLSARMEYPAIGQAMEEAGIDPATRERVIRRFGENYPDWDENSFPGYLANLVPGRIANRFDLGAASYAVDAACASSLCAIRLACSELRSGHCNLAVTGGVDTDSSVLAFTSFSKTRALSPSQQVRPYDAEGDGTMIAEGIGMLVLKRLSDARADGDRIYAVIRSIGASTDGRGAAIYAPRADGQARAMRSALVEAGLDPSGIGLIEGHGTGTAVGDGVELEALISVYGSQGGRRIPIGSVKSQIGHTKAAAGAASLIKTALALHHAVLPPTLGVSRPAPQIAGKDAPFGVMPRAQPWFRVGGAPRRAVVSAFGFGGTNYHAVLEASDDPKPAMSVNEVAPPWPASVLLQGVDAGALAALCRELAARPQDIARRTEMTGPARLAFAARSAGQAAQLLGEAADRLERRPEDRSWSLPSGLSFLAEPSEPGALVAVFSGQGSQYVGMGADLAVDHQAFRAAVEAMDAALVQAGEAPCSPIMLPPTMLGHPAPAEAAGQLRSPLYAQAAVGAFSLGALAVLREAGLRPDLFMGHSFGELSALCAAGSIGPDHYAGLVVARGQSLSPPDGTDAGGLIAIRATEAEVAALLPKLPGCAIANLNAPRQTVIGGATPALDAAEAVLAAAGVSAIRLPVAAGFHTDAVGYAKTSWQATLASTPLNAPRALVFANSTGRPYEGDADAVMAGLAAQPFLPVRFREQIEAAYEAGGRVFLEIGPKGVMTGLVAETLGDRPHVALAINPKPDGDSSLQLHQAVAALKLLGVPLADMPRPPAPRPRSATAIRISASGGLDRSRRRPARTSPESPVSVEASPAAPAALALPLAPTQTDRMPMNLAASKSDPAPAHSAAETVVALVAESHREFLAGQAALARMILERGVAGTDPAALALLREVQEGGVRLHEQYLTDQTLIAQGLLGTGAHAAVVPAAAPPPEPTFALPAAGPSVAPAPVIGAPAAAAPPAAATPFEPPMAQAPAVPEEADIETLLRRIIAEQTGYPEEILEPSMSLEADLGIDSIKRIEIVAATAKALGLERTRSSEAARRAGTLAELAALLRDTATAAPAAPAGAGAKTPATSKAAGGPDMPIFQVGLRTLPLLPAAGGAPVAGGVTLILDDGSALTDAMAIAVEDAGGIPVTLVLRQTGAADGTERKPAADRHHLAVPAGDAAALAAALKRVAGGIGPIRQAVLLAPTGDVAASEGLAELLGVAAALFKGGPGLTWLVAVSRLDGSLGLTGAGKGDGWQGAAAGLVKTALREMPGLQARAIDVDPSLDASQAALAILKELGAREDTVEVGVGAEGRCTLGLSPWLVGEGRAATLPAVGKADVILVSGGGRGVTALCARRLAEETGARLVLLGRTPRTAADPDWASGAVGRDLRAKASRHLGDTGEDATPRAVEATCRRVEAERELRTVLAGYEGAVSQVEYVAVDIADRAALGRHLADVTRRMGPVTGLVHGAGVLADRRIADFAPEDAARVFAPKLDGFANLMALLDQEALRRVAVFSSTAAFYGNEGQAAYAMANEALNKACFALARRHPQGRFVAMNWGPWAGGMVDEVLAGRFAARGMRLIAPDAGARAFTRMYLDQAPGGYQAVIGDGPNQPPLVHAAEATETVLEPGVA
jgi:acyl transferase domain-containing protein/nucleoside-diphosphate-sugar epimerase